MTDRKPLAAWLYGWFFVLLLAWGSWQALGALRSENAQRRLGEVLSWSAFLSGRTTAALNHVMAHDLPADRWFRQAGGAFRWAVFGSGGPQVRVGCDDWLFLTEELRPWPDAAANMRARLEAIGRIARRLEGEGTAVVVAVTPDKARVHAEQLCGASYAREAAARHAEAMAQLRAMNLRLVEWLPLFERAKAEGPVYWRTDTHWNLRGAELAAQAIAAAARDLPLRREAGIVTETASAETPYAGDLLRLMGLDQGPEGWRPAPDRQRVRTTRLPEAEGGLLDEAPQPEVVLLGSSYSLNGNFHGALQQALSARVLNFGRAGGGVTGGAREYFGSATAAETRPRLVVWEVLERGLGQPITAEERAFLDAQR
jgi:alginate O-acetyltransferase complex protein AlgJ